MEKQDLERLGAACPLRITMASGETILVERSEFILVAEHTVAVLVNRGGELRNVLLALRNVTTVESLGESAP